MDHHVETHAVKTAKHLKYTMCDEMGKKKWLITPYGLDGHYGKVSISSWKYFYMADAV